MAKMTGKMLNMIVLSQILWVQVFCEELKGDYWLSAQLKLSIAFSTLWILFIAHCWVSLVA